MKNPAGKEFSAKELVAMSKQKYNKTKCASKELIWVAAAVSTLRQAGERLENGALFLPLSVTACCYLTITARSIISCVQEYADLMFQESTSTSIANGLTVSRASFIATNATSATTMTSCPSSEL